jgi:micrococcal nuclease
MELYNYNAIVVRVIDGDTVKLNIDLGFNINWETNARMANINADELKSNDPILKESAQNAKKYLESILKAGDKVHIKSKELDKYKRPIVIITKQGLNLNEDLLNKGLVKKYE